MYLVTFHHGQNINLSRSSQNLWRAGVLEGRQFKVNEWHSGLIGAKQGPAQPVHYVEMLFVSPFLNPYTPIFIFFSSCPLSPAVDLSVCPSVCLSVSLSFCLSLSLSPPLPRLSLCRTDKKSARPVSEEKPWKRTSHVLTSQRVKYNRLPCHTTSCCAVDPRLAINTWFPSHNCSYDRLVWMEGEIGNAREKERLRRLLSICATVCVCVCVCVCLSVYALIKAQSRRSLETAKLFEIICTEKWPESSTYLVHGIVVGHVSRFAGLVRCTSLNRFDLMQTNRTGICQIWMREGSHHVAC